MRGSFSRGYLDSLALPPGSVRSISELGAYRGRQELFAVQSPQALEVLREVAVVQSVASSNRIEGVTAPAERIAALVAKKTTPTDRPEQEIAGYREALSLVHANGAGIWPITNGVVLQIDRAMNSFMPDPGGAWKSTNNDIVEWTPEGKRRVRFTPVTAHLVDHALRDIHESLHEAWEAGQTDPLVLSAAYVLDFLCVHPFIDGNGRMSRLLTLTLLYHAGIDVGRFISIERIVEESRETCYEALAKSSVGWHEAKHDLLPWLDYFLGVLLVAYREFEARVGAVRSPRGAKRDLVMDCVRHLPVQFRYADVERACPAVSRPTIERVLGQMRQAGEITLLKTGRDALWERIPL
jgi:Fic family protein